MSLPDHRRVIHGRTWPSMHRHAGWAGIEHVAGRETRVERIAGIVLAVVIGILGAMALVHWWSA